MKKYLRLPFEFFFRTHVAIKGVPDDSDSLPDDIFDDLRDQIKSRAEEAGDILHEDNKKDTDV